MTFWWPMTLLVVLSPVCWLPPTEGLKCHICDSYGMKNCISLWSRYNKNRYLKDCAPSAIACATFRVEPWSSTQVWFQRDCLYPSDVGPFKLDASNLPNKTDGRYLHWGYRKFFDYAEEANNLRKSASLPELTLAPESFRRINEDDPINYARIHSCSDEDGCNDWESFAVHPYADGYPADGHKAKLRSMDCYQCKVTDPYEDEEDARSCLDVKNKRKYYWYEDPDRYKIWFHDEDKYMSGGQFGDVYGCATLAIYQTSEFGMKPYFERNKWVFGDYWCLLQRYKNNEAGPDTYRDRSLVQYSKVRNGDDDGGEVKKSGCREGYARALNIEEDTTYNWVGHRIFWGMKEFRAYLKCRRDVRRKMLILYESMYPYPIQIPFNESAMEHDWTWKRNYLLGEPFAYVGFQFCGPNHKCNEWSDKQLYGIMKEPPTTTTTSTTTAPTTTTTTTTTPATTPSSTSPTRSTTTPRGKWKGDGDLGEIPDDGCRVTTSAANVPKSTLASVLMIWIWIAATDFLSWS